MNNATNTCNHTEEIAHAIYSQHHNELNPGIPPDWDALPEEEKQAWRKVAGNILPTLGQHALGDLLAYAKRKIKESSSTGKKMGLIYLSSEASFLSKGGNNLNLLFASFFVLFFRKEKI